MSADTWLEIFEAHPEFFTRDSDNLVSLVWRRNKERNYDVRDRRVLSYDETLRLKEFDPEPTAERLSRPPLDTEEISKLIDIAVSLHEREIQHQQERHWWYAAVIGAGGVLASLLSHLWR